MKAFTVRDALAACSGRFYGDESAVYEDGAFDSYYQQAKAAGDPAWK